MRHLSLRPGAAAPRRRSDLRVVIWSLVVAAALLVPGDELPDPGSWDLLEYLAHALLFGIHCLLLGGYGLVTAAVASGVYSVLLEVAQLWVPGRGFEWLDLVANAAGIALALLLLRRSRARLAAAS